MLVAVAVDVAVDTLILNPSSLAFVCRLVVDYFVVLLTFFLRWFAFIVLVAFVFWYCFECLHHCYSLRHDVCGHVSVVLAFAVMSVISLNLIVAWWILFILGRGVER